MQSSAVLELQMSGKSVYQELTSIASRDAVVSYRKRSVEVTFALMVCYVSDIWRR
jgi:hypothetical protein